MKLMFIFKNSEPFCWHFWTAAGECRSTCFLRFCSATFFFSLYYFKNLKKNILWSISVANSAFLFSFFLMTFPSFDPTYILSVTVLKESLHCSVGWGGWWMDINRHCPRQGSARNPVQYLRDTSFFVCKHCR